MGTTKKKKTASKKRVGTSRAKKTSSSKRGTTKESSKATRAKATKRSSSTPRAKATQSRKTAAKQNVTPIVAIDGPAACGKSTVARKVAAKLSVKYLDSGALYRAVTWSVLSEGVDPKDEKAVVRLVKQLKLTATLARGEAMKVGVNGVDVTSKLHQVKVSQHVSTVAQYSGIRSKVLPIQRAQAEGGVVAEGRDMVTVVFPNADVKLYLDASLTERVDRRYRDMKRAKAGIGHDDVEELVRRRDQQDRQRKNAPLRIAPEAIYIDTTALSVDEVVQRVLQLCVTGSRG